MGNWFGKKKRELNLDDIQELLSEKYDKRKNPDVGSEVWRIAVAQLIRDYLMLYHNTVFDLVEYKFLFLLTCCISEYLDDSELTVNVLETFFRTHYDRLQVFAILEKAHSLEAVLRHANERYFGFWGVRQGTGPLARDLSPVVECFNFSSIKTGRNKLVTIFLKYGFRYQYQMGVYMTRCFDFTDGRQGIQSPEFRRLMKRKDKFRFLLLMDTFFAFSYTKSREKIESVCYVYRSIPDPYIRPKEIRSEPHLEVMVYPDKHIEIYKIYKKFRNTPNECFDQENERLHARPLQHLCRCKIRYFLADKLELPDGIEKLGLPDKLITYLNLES